MKGFTFMELVVVILLLSVIAISASSRFMNIQGEALSAKNNQIASSFSQTIRDVQLIWLIQGKPQGTAANQGPVIDFNGQTIRVDPSTGFPVGNHSIDNIVTVSITDCRLIFNRVIQHSYTVARRNDVTIADYKDFDFIVSRTNSNPDICNYYWSTTLQSVPGNENPNQGLGIRYYPETGEVSTFEFL